MIFPARCLSDIEQLTVGYWRDNVNPPIEKAPLGSQTFPSMSVVFVFKHIETEIKWRPSWRRYFQMHVLG